MAFAPEGGHRVVVERLAAGVVTRLGRVKDVREVASGQWRVVFADDSTCSCADGAQFQLARQQGG